MFDRLSRAATNALQQISLFSSHQVDPDQGLSSKSVIISSLSGSFATSVRDKPHSSNSPPPAPRGRPGPLLPGSYLPPIVPGGEQILFPSYTPPPSQVNLDMHPSPITATNGSPSRSLQDARNTQSLAAVSAAEVSLESSVYAQRARRLVNMVNTMRDAGAHMDLDLPTVVVCGNQSVGKSSVIEALCGIVLPRNEGTCTRCVTEVRMSEQDRDAATASAWSCNVKLRYEYDSHGRPLKAVKEVAFGKEITNKEDVDITVRRAQKALLNPSKDPAQYLHYSFDDSSAAARDKEGASNELKFVKNVVCLDIHGAGVNLTLIDLPGIIRTIDRKDDVPYIQLVEDLVRFYITKSRAIIVATITCKDEIENQAIVHMAKEVDPYGMRTLGVLTKPDTIEAGTHDRWLSIMMGQQYGLKLGYYMIKNPSKADLDRQVSFADARRMEETFFSTQPPWSTIRHQMDRFGVDSLRRELSRQLTLLTEMSIPDMQGKTDEAIQKTMMELNTLPPSVDENSRIELLHMIRHFCTLINYNVTAHQDFKQFYQLIRRHFDIFRESIAITRPTFAMNMKGGQTPAHFTTSITSSISSSISSVVGWGGSVAGARQQPKPPSPSEEASIDTRRTFTVADVRKIIEAQKGRELQGYSAYDAFTYLVTVFQDDWARHGQACLASVSHELNALVTKVTEEMFGRFVNMQGQVRFVIQAFQTELYRATSEVINNLVAMERRYPFTMGAEEFTRTKSAALNEFRSQLEASKSGASGNNPLASGKSESINKALAALTEAGFTGLTPRDLSRLRAESPEDDEVLHVMSACHAYFRLASRRFSDNVPMNIDFHFVSRFAETLEKELIARLGLLDKDMAAVRFMLQEDRFVAERRRALEERKLRLETVWRSLHEYGM